jgi:DNA integrity scanning protein DisA with diadenylate cyclase activity
MCWWIVCNVPSASSRREWAEKKLGNRHSALLFEKTRLWCMIVRNANGAITVEYNGRKMVLDE